MFATDTFLAPPLLRGVGGGRNVAFEKELDISFRIPKRFLAFALEERRSRLAVAQQPSVKRFSLVLVT